MFRDSSCAVAGKQERVATAIKDILVATGRFLRQLGGPARQADNEPVLLVAVNTTTMGRESAMVPAVRVLCEPAGSICIAVALRTTNKRRQRVSTGSVQAQAAREAERLVTASAAGGGPLHRGC